MARINANFLIDAADESDFADALRKLGAALANQAGNPITALTPAPTPAPTLPAAETPKRTRTAKEDKAGDPPAPAAPQGAVQNPTPAPAATPTPATPAAPAGATLADIQARGGVLVKLAGNNVAAILAIFKEFGASKGGELKPDQFDAVLARINTEIATREAMG